MTLGGVAVLLAVWAGYVASLCPTVWMEDSGELIAAGTLLGVAHPPGYPLYTVLVKLAVTLVPVGSMGFRANLVSAGGALASCMMLWRWGLARGASPWAAAAAALVWAFSKTLWSQAVFAEVYGLNAALIAGAWAAAGAWARRPGGARLAWWWAMVGLGLANHLTVWVLLPVFLWMARPVTLANRRAGALLILAAGLGIACYALLPLRSMTDPGVDWGDPSVWGRFWTHMLRKQYGQITGVPRTIGFYAQQAGAYVRWAAGEFGWGLAFAGAAGWAWRIRHAGPEGRGLAAGWALTSLGVIGIINFPLQAYDLSLVRVFFVPSYFFLALGLLELMAAAARALPAAAPALLLLAAWGGVAPGPNEATGRRYAAADYGQNLLAAADPGGVVFASSDNQKFTMAYLALVEGWRPDLSVYDETGCVFDHVFGNDVQSLTAPELAERHRRVGQAVLASGRPVYHAVGSNLPAVVGRPTRPQGLIKAFQASTLRARDEVWRRCTFRSLWELRPGDSYMLREALAQYYLSWAEAWFERAAESGGAAADEARARACRLLKRGSAVALDIAPLHNNVAITFATHRLFGEAEAELQVALALNPQYRVAQQNLEVLRAMQRRPGEAVSPP